MEVADEELELMAPECADDNGDREDYYDVYDNDDDLDNDLYTEMFSLQSDVSSQYSPPPPTSLLCSYSVSMNKPRSEGIP